ncbi:uncharacterized protein LOC119312871 [Triticum dicoccoides]|uniref:uncharacterized protein LOC119312871 n=1 Tax=Triticum dicoccoides TaxID=85692 RepID=UPI0018919ECF|nr:uncharacterized protein LOC119312871 [Triticum dicoccoides]
MASTPENHGLQQAALGDGGFVLLLLSCTVVQVLEIADDGRSGRSRAIGRFLAAAVEEADAQEDGVLLPKEGSEAARRYPLYLSKEVPEDAALPITVFDRQLVLFLPSIGEEGQGGEGQEAAGQEVQDEGSSMKLGRC